MIEFLYWSGYVICFIFTLLFGAWAIANEEKVDMFNVLIAIVILPFFSWLLILLTALSIGFEVIRAKKDKE